MSDKTPCKPAMRLMPGELLIDGQERNLVLGVSYVPARDIVKVRVADGDRTYRLDEPVPVMARWY